MDQGMERRLLDTNFPRWNDWNVSIREKIDIRDNPFSKTYKCKYLCGKRLN